MANITKLCIKTVDSSEFNNGYENCIPSLGAGWQDTEKGEEGGGSVSKIHGSLERPIGIKIAAQLRLSSTITKS